MDEMLFTNIDVTSSMFAYALINVARNQQVQDALRAEILSVERSPEETADYAQKEDTLLHKTYLEVLRHNPPACKSIPWT